MDKYKDILEIFASFHYPVLLMQEQGSVCAFNKTFRELFSYENEEDVTLKTLLIERLHIEILDGEEELFFINDSHQDSWVVCKTNFHRSEMVMLLRKTVVTIDRVNYYAVLFENSTLSYTIENHLTSVLGDSILKKLTQGLAHDFNNKLASVMGGTEYLLSTTDENDESYEFMKALFDSVKEAVKISQYIVSLCQKIETMAAPLTISSVVEKVCELFIYRKVSLELKNEISTDDTTGIIGIREHIQNCILITLLLAADTSEKVTMSVRKGMCHYLKGKKHPCDCEGIGFHIGNFHQLPSEEEIFYTGSHTFTIHENNSLYVGLRGVAQMASQNQGVLTIDKENHQVVLTFPLYDFSTDL